MIHIAYVSCPHVPHGSILILNLLSLFQQEKKIVGCKLVKKQINNKQQTNKLTVIKHYDQILNRQPFKKKYPAYKTAVYHTCDYSNA